MVTTSPKTRRRNPMESSATAGLLSPYRVLDLTSAECLLCGKILADLGADVIQIEPPGGHVARRIGPFYRGEVQAERILYWWALIRTHKGMRAEAKKKKGQNF